MFLNYGIFGIYADIAIIFNLFLIVSTLSLIEGTLTMPGIAGIVLTGGGSQLKNIVPFAKEMLGIPIRIGKPTVNIKGNKNFADNPINSTLLGLLLWPLYSNEHKALDIINTSIFEKFKQIIKDFF